MTSYKTTIRDGDNYYDEEIVVVHMPKKELRSPIAQGVAEYCGHTSIEPMREVVGHERISLRWMKPDGTGKLVPR